MASYALVSVWRIEAPLRQVWEALCQTDKWPSWWPFVTSVETISCGNDLGVDAVHRYAWETRLPYRLYFDLHTTRVKPMRLLEAEVNGDLQGTGRCQLYQNGDLTTVRYEWNVSTRKLWMNFLAPVIRPIFTWNHHSVMKAGGEGLALQLRAHSFEFVEPDNVIS